MLKPLMIIWRNKPWEIGENILTLTIASKELTPSAIKRKLGITESCVAINLCPSLQVLSTRCNYVYLGDWALRSSLKSCDGDQ